MEGAPLLTPDTATSPSDSVSDEKPPYQTCKSCENSFYGFFCNLCGEKVILPADKKLRTFLSNILIATSILDNKFLTSLWLTIRKPGFLSREYTDGRRVKYMRPLQMFFILNLAYFLFPVLQMFNSSLFTQTNILPHRSLARTIAAHKIIQEELTVQGFELIYNDKTTRLAKLCIVLFVLLASVPLSLIYFRKSRYFTDHVALSVELASFNLAINAIGLTLLIAILSRILTVTGWGLQHYLNDLTLTIVFIVTNFYFLFLASRNFYQEKGKRVLFKTVLSIMSLFLALEGYRFLLFFLTIWSI
jgi:hypothetical protein